MGSWKAFVLVRFARLALVLAGVALTLVVRHPLMPVYLNILHHVIAR